MSNIKKKIIHSFKWKKNNTYCADKLGITVKRYTELKNEILKDRKDTRNLNKISSKKVPRDEISTEIK